MNIEFLIIIFACHLYNFHNGMVYPVGCHVVAPSDMMDNRVAAIKRRLADADLAGKVSRPHQIDIKPSGKSQSRSDAVV